jgi:internalin A
MTSIEPAIHSSEIRGARRSGVLNLSRRGISHLPRAVRSVPRLSYLNLSHNNLDHFPAELLHMPNLQTLDIGHNFITEIPPEISNLQKLEVLRIENNRITNLPPELAPMLRNGLYLQAEGNPLSELLPELLGQERFSDLATYLESLVDGVPQYEAKVLFVGEGNVGKTSLVAALRNEPFVSGRPTTHGIKIHELVLPYPNRDFDLTLRTWDFGGQEVYRITHQFFFGRRALYLVVWNSREGQEQNEVEGWLRRIRLRVGPEAQVLVVATHLKERNPELDYPSLQRTFPDMLRGQYAVDSSNNDGVEELRQAIAREAARLPLVGQAVSSRWIAARNEILSRAAGTPQITFAEFSLICKFHGLLSHEIPSLAELLHDLGQIIYYGDDEGLRDVVVLNPEWLTQAIGCVLEDKPTRANHGVLDHRRLRNIWLHVPDGGSYPTEYHPYFLRLMEKFDVSYRLDDDQHSLVAQLVPHERPEIPWDQGNSFPEGLRSLRLICHMSEPAPGLIAWLTVRNHRSSTNRHWRAGVFLRHPIDAYDSEALVELQSDKNLLIEVRAPSPDLFFNVLRDGVEDLLINRWPGLEYSLLVPCPSVVNGDPCDGKFPLDGLLRLRERGKTFYDCLQCDTEHDVPELITGFASADLTPELEKLQVQIDEVADGVKNIERIATESAASIRRVLRAMSEEVVDCPRLFTMSVEEPRFYNRIQFWQRAYRLTLWCEHPSAWHAWTAAAYSIQKPRKWLMQIAPYAALVAKTLKVVVPVTGSVVGLILSEEDLKTIEKQLDLMTTLAEQLPDNFSHTGEADVDEKQGQLSPAQGAGLRGLRHTLIREDPTQKFGDLRRVQGPSGEYLWVCPNHYGEYDPGLPILPQ